jgi:hypothetical protein
VLKGVAVCQHSLILSSFFKIDCTLDPVLSNALQTLNWISALVCLVTFSFTATGRLFPRIFTEAFFHACVYALITHK